MVCAQPLAMIKHAPVLMGGGYVGITWGLDTRAKPCVDPWCLLGTWVSQLAEEAFRPLVAALHGCEPVALELVADRIGIKPGGCPALVDHVDKQRVGTFQVVIVLTSVCTPMSPHPRVGGQGGRPM